MSTASCAPGRKNSCGGSAYDDEAVNDVSVSEEVFPLYENDVQELKGKHQSLGRDRWACCAARLVTSDLDDRS